MNWRNRALPSIVILGTSASGEFQASNGRLIIGMTMYASAFVPGFEHFDNEYFTPRKVTLNPLFGSRISFGIAKPNSDNKPVTNQPV